MTDRIYPNTFYGDNVRWFFGVVEDIYDPMKLGRVRVRIHGIHTQNQNDIQTTDLPWAQTIVPTTEGGVSGIGLSPGLQNGARVFGIFMDGQASQIPLIIGSVPTIESSSPIQRRLPGNNEIYGRHNGGGSVGPGTGSTGRRNGIIPDVDFSEVGGNTNAEIAFNYFVVYGFTHKQAAGIVGNLMVESTPKLNTSIKAAGSEQSYGIAQWNAAGGRYQELREFARDLGRDWTDLDIQLKFITYELETYPYLGLALLRSSTTIEEAVIAFETKYERPGIPHRQSRINYAYDIYKRMLTS